METTYDWVTIVIFAALVTKFLQASAGPRESNESIWHYLVPSVGCAAANWLGNDGRHVAAIAVLLASLAFILMFIVRPGRRES